jgi:hypothetical protein
MIPSGSERRWSLMSLKRIVPRETPSTKPVLLKTFPVALHREMKATAIRQGLRVTALYIAACEQFLRASRPGKGGETR